MSFRTSKEGLKPVRIESQINIMMKGEVCYGKANTVGNILDKGEGESQKGKEINLNGFL